MKHLLKNWLFKNKESNLTCKSTLSFLAKGLFVFFIIHCFTIKAQTNLVPNPSFETYTFCPNAGGQINYATPWIGTSGGVEYFNSCSAVYSVPFQNYGSAGFQYARTGNAFAAIFMLNGYGNNYREYLQVQLNDTLQNSQCYLICFYVNLQNPINLAVNNFGVYISNTLFTTGTPFGVPPYIPQILKYKNDIINDTLNWTMISGIYTATGGEKCISIGNFYDDANTDTVHTGGGPPDAAYYFIDDVSVIPIDSILGGILANAGNDTTILGGDSVFIGQQITNLNCNWYIGSTLIADSVSGLYVSPSANTTYIVEQNLCGIITYDTLTVYVSGVGISESDWSKKINLYPNPSAGEFTIELSAEANPQWNISITDVQGRIILSELPDNNSVKLKPVAENGVYLVHITNMATNETAIRKLIIQK